MKFNLLLLLFTYLFVSMAHTAAGANPDVEKVLESMRSLKYEGAIFDPLAKKCAENIQNLWLDIYFIVDISRIAKSFVDANELGESLADLIKPLNFNSTDKRASRAGLITIGGESKVQLEIGSGNIRKNFLDLKNDASVEPDFKGAFELVTKKLKEDKSDRPQLIISIAAFHNSTEGLKVFNTSIRELKSNGIPVITISLVPFPAVLDTNETGWIIALGHFGLMLSHSVYTYHYQSPKWQNNLREYLLSLNCSCPNGKQIDNECIWGYPGLSYPSLPICYNGFLASIPNLKTFNFIKSNILNDDKLNDLSLTIGLHKSVGGEWHWYDYENETIPYTGFPPFENDPKEDENYGYLQKIKNGEWILFAGNDSPKAYLCQNKPQLLNKVCNGTYKEVCEMLP